MHILVIGGTNFIGPYVVNNLAEAGHQVSVLHRHPGKRALAATVREITGDREQLSTDAETLRALKPDVILDMVVWYDRHIQDLLTTFADVTRRIVMVSSQDVYQAFGRVNGSEKGEADPRIITEDAPLRAIMYPHRGATPRAEDDPDYWQDTYDKIPAERLLMSNSQVSGTVLRLPAVYGPYDARHRMFAHLKRMLDGRPAILLENGIASWRWSHSYVENVAHAITLAVINEQASGHIYNVSEPVALSVAEQIDQLARVVNWHGRVISLPSESLPESLHWGVNTEQNIIVDSSRIREELGYKEKIDLEEAFRRTVAWERDNWPTEIDPETFDYAAEDAILAGL